jgi:hypothetical protein
MGGPRARDLYVFKDILEAMDGPWRDKIDRQACGYLRREFDRFVEGGVVSLALKPFDKAYDAFFAILHPPEDKVFALRVRAPYPGVRVFGCFAGTNTFVATKLGAARLAYRFPGWEQSGHRRMGNRKENLFSALEAGSASIRSI